MVVRVAVVLFCLQLLYLAVGNALLRSDLIKNQVQRSEDFHLEYGEAYTLWLGHVHVRDLSLRFEDYNVQFLLGFTSVELDLSVSQLLFKKFHVSKLDAHGTSFRFRHKLIVVGDDAERVAAYPPIRGFADPPYYVGVRSPPVSDEDYDLWQVQIEHVTARVSELWVMEHRFVGEGVASGSFIVRPSRWVQVEPAELTLERGKLTLGRHLVAAQVRGRVRCSIPDMWVQKVEGAKVLKEITSSIRLELERGELDFLQAYLGRVAPVTYSGAADWLLDVHVQRGVVQLGSHARLSSPAARFGYEDLSLAGPLSVLLERNASEAPDHLRLSWSAPRLQGARKGNSEGAPSAEGLTGELRLNAVDLTGAPSLDELQIAASAVKAPSLAWFEVPDTQLGGAALASFALQRSSSGLVSGQAQLGLKAGRLKRGSFGAAADLESKLSLAQPAGAGSPWRFDRLLVTASRCTLRDGEKHTQPFAARLDAAGLQLLLGDEPSLDGTLKLHVSPTEALLPLVMSNTLKNVGDALLGLSTLDARARLKVEAGGVDVTGLEARDGKLRLRGHVSKRGADPRGAFLVSSGPLNVGVTLAGGDTQISPLVGDDWLATSALRN